MNQLSGTIREIQTEGQLSLVRIQSCGLLFSSIVIDNPDTAKWLAPGNQVLMIFKENEVVIARSFSGQISMQNQFPSIITAIEMGSLLARVSLRFHETELVSLITSRSAVSMKLAAGDEVTAMVKTNEISLSPHDRF